MLLAVVLAAAIQPCESGSTYDMRMCWSRQDDAARDRLHATYQDVTAEMGKLRIDPRPLAAAQSGWAAARDKTCTFEYELNLPGTIAPLLAVECDYRMTQARFERLTALQKRLRSREAPPPREPASQKAAGELDRLYRLYQSHLGQEQWTALETAESAWITYRDKACAIEGGACLTELDKERIAELEAAWIGEPFWN